MQTTGDNKKESVRLGIPVLVALILAGSVTLVTGCGKKGDGGPAQPPAGAPVVAGPVSACPTCSGNAQLIAAAVGVVRSAGYELALQFFADGNIYGNPGIGNGYGLGTLGGLGSYSGSIQAYGHLRVLNNVSTYCQLPIGDYEVYSVAPGTGYSTGSSMSISGLQLQGTGAGAVSIVLNNNFLTASVPPAVGSDGQQYPFRLQNDVQIVPVGGTYTQTAYGPVYNQCPSYLTWYVLE